MGNSPSKQDSSDKNLPKLANRSNTKRRLRNSAGGIREQEPLGIMSHPYQQANPEEYHHETSSDEDDHYLHPRGLFKENISPRNVLPPQEKRRSTQSMGSLAYSESTASAVSFRQNDISKGTLVSTSGKAKSENKKGLFARFQKKKRSLPKEEIPFEQSLEYAKSRFYGESQEEEDFSDDDDDEDDDDFSNGFNHSSRHQQRNSFPPRPYHTRHGSMNGGNNLSIFMDEKRLPTIPDVSYQSSTAEYEAEEDVQDVSNLLGDLVEHDYQEEETSMLSKEYTVETEEAKDLPHSYSDVKNESDRSNATEYIRTMNSMLDKQHASYVDGQEPLKEIEMPRQNLGTLFASVNLTLNDTMNGSKYKSLDDSHTIDGFEETALFNSFDEEDKMRAKSAMQEPKDNGDDSFDHCVENSTDLSKEGTVKAMANKQNVSDDVVDDNSKSVQSGLTSSNSTGSRKAVLINAKAGRSCTKADDTIDETELLHSAQLKDDFNESSVDDSNIDESLCYSKARDISDVLSESTVDRSKTDSSLFQGKNACIQDELSESSEEEENILDCTGYDILNSTDMTIRHSLPVKSASNEAHSKMLDILEGEESSEESASKILEDMNQDAKTVVSQTDKRSNLGEERKSSPYPEIDMKAPTTSSVANLLPALTNNDEDDENEKDLMFVVDDCHQMKERIAVQPKCCDIDRKVVDTSKKDGKHGNQYKGPEIGTVIQLIRMMKSNDIVLEKSEEETVHKSTESNQKKVAEKIAYSRQVAKNSVFLFSDQNVRREQPRVTSKVDQERLTLLKEEFDVTEECVLQDLQYQITSSDSLESIMEKLEIMKIENRKAFLSKRSNPSVKISKSDAELKVTGFTRHLPTLNVLDEMRHNSNSLSSPLEKESSVKLPIQPISKVGGAKRSGDEATVNEESFVSMKKNKLDSESSFTQKNTCETNVTETNDNGDDGSGHSINSDDISISELQNRHSAITPMKNPKSPYIRFKKAMRMFGKSEIKSSNLKHPRKSPPRRNASSTKDDFVITKDLSFDERVGASLQNSTTQKRRLTSGIDVIAPRKPTLTNPMFRKAVSSEMENNVDVRPQINHNLANETDAALDQPDSPYDERDELHLAAVNKDDRNSPLSESSADDDDFDDILKASSMESPSIGASIDDFEQVLHNSSDGSTNRSPQSSLDDEEPSGLRSAIKKNKGDKNTTNRVSWFGGIHSESSEVESKLNRRLENSFVQSPDGDTTSSDKAPSKRTRMSSFQVYSPARESLASHSPPIAFSQSIKAPVNPTQMNMHSPFEHASTTAHEESVASFSPVLGSTTFPPKRETAAAVGNGSTVLSPVTGRRTPSQNKKWTTGMTPTKNWRQLKAEQDAKKKTGSKKKKKRFSGPLKAFNY
jgi:hypothetical protein